MWIRSHSSNKFECNRLIIDYFCTKLHKVGHSKKICKPRFNTNIRKYFSQIESLTDGTVCTGTLLMHQAWTVSKMDWIKFDPQGRVSLWTGPPVMWVDVKIRPHKVSTNPAHRQNDRMNDWRNEWMADKPYWSHNLCLGGGYGVNASGLSGSHRLLQCVMQHQFMPTLVLLTARR